MSSSYQFKFDHSKKRLLQTFSGDIDFAKLISLTIKLHNDPDYSPDMDCILDLSDCNLLLSFDDMSRFVEFLTNTEKRLRGHLAIIAKSPATYGTTRIFAGLGEDLQGEINYFQSIADAEKWLEGLNKNPA